MTGSWKMSGKACYSPEPCRISLEVGVGRFEILPSRVCGEESYGLRS